LQVADNFPSVVDFFTVQLPRAGYAFKRFSAADARELASAIIFGFHLSLAATSRPHKPFVFNRLYGCRRRDALTRHHTFWYSIFPCPHLVPLAQNRSCLKGCSAADTQKLSSAIIFLGIHFSMIPPRRAHNRSGLKGCSPADARKLASALQTKRGGGPNGTSPPIRNLHEARPNGTICGRHASFLTFKGSCSLSGSAPTPELPLGGGAPGLPPTIHAHPMYWSWVHWVHRFRGNGVCRGRV